MNTTFVKDYAIKVLLEETLNEKSTLIFFKNLINNGLIDGERLKKGCINHFYDKACKDNGGSNKNAILDTAIEFDCTTRTVYNVVYNFTKVRLRFN